MVVKEPQEMSDVVKIIQKCVGMPGLRPLQVGLVLTLPHPWLGFCQTLFTLANNSIARTPVCNHHWLPPAER